MEVVDAEMRIEKLNELLEGYKRQLKQYEKECEERDYLDTPEAQEEVKKYEEMIAAIQEEIEAYQVYKETGVFMSRQTRQLLKKAKAERKQSEAKKEEEGR